MMCNFFFNFHFTHEAMVKMVSFILLGSFLWIIQLCQYWKNDLLFIYHQNKYVKTVIYALIAYLIVGWGIMKPEQFIYFQF